MAPRGTAGRFDAPDQDASTSLVAVTARTNRSKADQDPSQWMPPLPDAHCRYIGERFATKLRWGLAADQSEADSLEVYADACETTVVHYPRPLTRPEMYCAPESGIVVRGRIGRPANDQSDWCGFAAVAPAPRSRTSSRRVDRPRPHCPARRSLGLRSKHLDRRPAGGSQTAEV